ncbi:MAG: type II secretion system protein [Candidatus Omnitrophota bacterium]|jgi:prepilin-type N-terminal cleavage/methylation domain-containing protein
MNNRRAFSLVEIMVVTGIVVVLISLAVPNILRSRVIGMETAALGNLRALNNACQLYQINRKSYPDSLPELSEPRVTPPYIDPELATGSKQGYQFVYSLGSSDHFTVNANPLSSGLLRGRFFYMDESGQVHAKNGGAAGADDPVLF